jgi:endonuclease YncB( thermonuclease family)
VGGADLAAWLVLNGHALDWPQYSKGEYATSQEEARRNKRGVWAGSFVEPWRYRICLRSGGSKLDCSRGKIF